MQKYFILQLNENNGKKLFRSYDDVCKKYGNVNIDDYDIVYSGDIDDTRLSEPLLDELFRIFNISKPDDFHGHSLSVSDIIYVKGTGFYYVDDYGFKKLR